MISKVNSLFKRPMPGITFGGASLSGEGGGYGFGEMSEKDAEKLIHAAFENGITLFDTAPIYGFGLSEERLGRYLPKKAQVVSKSGVDWHESKRVNMSNTPEVTEKMLHQSLRRLQREQIDLYMVHWPDSRIDIRVPLEVLKKAQIEGKIKHIGLCNTNLIDLKRASEICEIDAIQSELNLFNQMPFDSLDREWEGKFSMGWGTFDKGILSGRVTADRKFTSDDCRSWAPWWNKKDVLLKVERTKRLSAILSDFHLSLPAFCIHYNLNYYGLSTCLIGFKSSSDILEVVSNLQTNISKEIIEEVLGLWNNTRS
jgi:aryl-alcohol dehydrogenase-like predicted oxidoreductase